MTTRYTKTAISLQTGLFSRAESYAAAHRLSRSELYAKAVTEYLERHETEELTARMNAIYTEEDSSLPEWVTAVGDEAPRQANTSEDLGKTDETR